MTVNAFAPGPFSDQHDEVRHRRRGGAGAQRQVRARWAASDGPRTSPDRSSFSPGAAAPTPPQGDSACGRRGRRHGSARKCSEISNERLGGRQASSSPPNSPPLSGTISSPVGSLSIRRESTPSPRSPRTSSSSTSIPAGGRRTAFGGTVAHGFLTLSLLARPWLIARCPESRAAVHGVNYGFDRVRFVHPVPSGSQGARPFLPLQAVTPPLGVRMAIRPTGSASKSKGRRSPRWRRVG